MKSNQKIITLRSSRKSSLKRKSSIKRMYSTALIVCEGKNTEINYFKGLVSRLGIQANVDVKTTVRGSSPDNVLNSALKLKDMILLVNSIIHNKPITTLEA